MSIRYYCDYCGQIIRNEDKVVLNTMITNGDKKFTSHLHKDCWERTIKPLFSNIKGDTSSEQKCDIPTTENSDKVLTVDVDRDKYREFELTESKGITKYFSNEVCSKLHRFILLNSKPQPLSTYFNIPRQNINLYIRMYTGKGLDSYKPLVDVLELERIKDEYGRQIPKVKALLATCTWSFNEVANECQMPENIIRTIWNELPYFVKNCSNSSDEVRLLED